MGSKFRGRNNLRNKNVTEDKMIKRYLITPLVLSLALGLVGLGCGGAAAEGGDETTVKKSTRPKDPFGGSGDLRAGSKSTSEKEVSYSDDDLKIPGEEYGLASQGKRKKCRKGKKGNKCRAANASIMPFSDGIGEQMAGIPWGMHYKTVMRNFEKKIKDSYGEELKNVGGAIEEDHLRSQMLREITKLRKSYIKFDGSRTGFEQNFVSEEFVHNNEESMIVYDAEKYVDHLFFMNGRFWKRVWAFRKDKLGDLSFQDYYSTLVGRFGEGKEVMDDAGRLTKIRWMDDDTYMASVDKSGFYGVYLLVFSARVTDDNLAQLRPAGSGDDKDEVSSMVDTVTSGELSDHNTSVIDGYTGSNVGGASGNTTIDSSNSVMNKNKKKDDAEGEEKKEGKEEEANLDDLF
jgi:hypothetical protein